MELKKKLVSGFKVMVCTPKMKRSATSGSINPNQPSSCMPCLWHLAHLKSPEMSWFQKRSKGKVNCSDSHRRSLAGRGGYMRSWSRTVCQALSAPMRRCDHEVIPTGVWICQACDTWLHFVGTGLKNIVIGPLVTGRLPFNTWAFNLCYCEAAVLVQRASSAWGQMVLYLSRALVTHLKPEPQETEPWKHLPLHSLCDFAITTGVC